MVIEKACGYSMRSYGSHWWGIIFLLPHFCRSGYACTTTTDSTTSGVTTPRPAEKQLESIEARGTSGGFFLLPSQSGSMNGEILHRPSQSTAETQLGRAFRANPWFYNRASRTGIGAVGSNCFNHERRVSFTRLN